MIAGRRERKRPLIRSSAMTAAVAKSLSPRDGAAAFQRGSSTGFGRIASGSPYAMSESQADMATYMRQLSILHAAGILSDEEYSAARGRLIGS